MARTDAHDLHIFLSREQHSRLQRVARSMRQPMTTIARSAIIGYLNSYEEEEQGKEDRARERETGDKERRKPSGLGVSFEPKLPPPPPPAVPPTLQLPVSLLGSVTPDLKPIVEHLRGAATQEEKDRRLSTISETVRTFCEAKEAENIIRKLKSETETSGFSRLIGALGLGK